MNLHEQTLYGACGCEGCLTCTPLFVVTYDARDGSISEIQLESLSYTTIDRETYHHGN